MNYPSDYIDKIICGDALSVMSSMPDSVVDLVFTSPPYNLRNSSGNGMKDGRGGKWSSADLLNGYTHTDDNLPHDVYVDWQRQCLSEMMRVLSPEGAVFYNHKWRVQKGILQDRHDILDGFPVRQIIIWQRSGGINFNPGYFLPTYEVIYLIANKGFRLADKANAYGDVWKIPQSRGIPHPASFPLELAKRVISSTTAEVVLDPFVGSGTTALAAKMLGRSFIGIDISREYCDLAESRMLTDIELVD